jgi:hypothetical protein
MACIYWPALFISPSPEMRTARFQRAVLLNGAIHFRTMPASPDGWGEIGENLPVSRAFAAQSDHFTRAKFHGPIPLTFAGSLFQLKENMGATERS